MLVVSCCRKLQVFALPEDIASGTPWELVHVRTLGGVAPMEFQFSVSDTGCVAFTDGCGARLLLVTDVSLDKVGAVHVVDVVRGTHVGYVAAPGTIMYPGGVATGRGDAAAVLCWEGGAPVVRVFEGSGATWTAVRVITGGGGFDWPYGLRFTADGLRLAVADFGHQRLCIFCAQDGTFLRDITLLPYEPAVFPSDVEECGAEWVMCHPGGLVAVADNANDPGTVARRYTVFNCLALALVPGLGLVVRHETGVQFFATPDAVAMAAMSSCKVAWMAAVCRGMFSRVGFFLSHN